MNIDQQNTKSRNIGKISLAALGIIFGDIGTSPLYALRECFTGTHAFAVTPSNIYGILSLIIYSLILIISVKYLFYVLRADNRGEGGILALCFLVRSKDEKGFRYGLATVLGLLGAALMFGDGMITPAISVLSALEGISIIEPSFDRFIIPLAIGVLLGLFLLQKKGTATIGKLFGPVMLVWFVVLGSFGLNHILREPNVLYALNPYWAFQFLIRSGLSGFFVLGAVFLVVTGGEAIYADLGHFGRLPIKLAWFLVVLPALSLNYLGQGALLLAQPKAAINPFFFMIPHIFLIPIVILAACATIIASQAVITGVFSLTAQAVQLGFLPRLTIKHTSAAEKGQVYVPAINILLCLAVFALVLGFQNSSGLAAAYGVAVSITMLITTLLAYRVAVRLWNWPWGLALLLSLVFFIVDVCFLSSNLIKIKGGGWIPLVVGAVFIYIFMTWKSGQARLGERFKKESLDLSFIIKEYEGGKIKPVPGIAVYFSATPGITPPAMLHNLKHNKVIHENNIFVTVKTKEVPYVTSDEEVKFNFLSKGFSQVFINRGFMQDLEIPLALNRARAQGLIFDSFKATYILSRNVLVPRRSNWFQHLTRGLFSILYKNALDSAKFFNLPPNQVIEIGRLMPF